MPDGALLEKAGITTQEAQNYISRVKAIEALSGGGSGGSGGGGGNGYTGKGGSDKDKEEEEDDNGFDGNKEPVANKTTTTVDFSNATGLELLRSGLPRDLSSVSSMGFGPINAERLAELVSTGEVIAYEDNGVVKFKKGYAKAFNSLNYGKGPLNSANKELFSKYNISQLR